MNSGVKESPCAAVAAADAEAGNEDDKMIGEEHQHTAAVLKNAVTAAGDNDATAASTAASSSSSSLRHLVPQLTSHGITQADLETAVRVLNALASLDPKNNKKKKNSKQQIAANKKRKKNPPPSPNDPDEDGNVAAANSNCNDDEDATNADFSDNVSFLQDYQKPNLRPLRKALASCLELHRQTMFAGKDEEEHYEQRKQERSLKRQKTAAKAQYKKYIASTTLRQGRVEKLKALMQQHDFHDSTLLLIPDGHVETTSSTPRAASCSTVTTRLLTNGPTTASANTTTSQKIGDASAMNNDNDENHGGTVVADEDGAVPSSVKLPQLRSCYVCKVRYRNLHHFYDQLCPACAALNWQKRHATCNLRGRVAIVTGSRVKIGYQTVLKLLRGGCHVVATTRFPQTAAAAFRHEPDFDNFGHLLDIYGLDLRDVTGLEAFTRYLKQQHCETGIDILINNACQTVRRPVAYYRPLVEQEQALWQTADEMQKSLLKGCREFEHLRRKLLLTSSQNEAASGSTTVVTAAALGSRSSSNQSNGTSTRRNLKLENGSSSSFQSIPTNINTSILEINEEDDDAEKKPAATSVVVRTVDKGEEEDATAATAAPFESTGLSHSAAMSQTILLPEDAGVSDSVLPPGVTDVNGHQVDLRTTNSWLLKMEEVSTPEVMECMFINAIAPFVLNSRLKPLMTIPHDDEVGDETKRRPDRYIINVSAMEGKFYRYKMPNHPHTNMAKAALNMLTRTSAEDLAKKHRIFMNSVDTGWINDENPLQKASQTAKQNIFQTPIDEVDAAARILDPIFAGVNDPNHAHDYGKFLKDYRETEW